MNVRRAILAALLCLCFSGCESRPESDARRSLARGDHRLVGFMGVGLVVPGTTPDFQYWSYNPGIRALPDLSDTSPSDEIMKADRYASRYNAMILEATSHE